MTFAPGVHLGHYEIVGPLGAGGMGEVYRALDPKLQREVALKILPETFAADPARLNRFEHEARALAALNHANIAQIHGYEEDPRAAPAGAPPVQFLVLELVEGETLAERLAFGPLPLDEALPVARQLAAALAAAHAHGIIHRDLKPANIKLTAEGTVKVLDFGLAKFFQSSAATSSDLANSPTRTDHLTEQGVILGTAAYMAPEQAKGRPVDKGIDIWAFGTVLYEMLTGQPVFGGENAVEVLGAILNTEIDFGRLPAGTPPAIRRLMRRCLVKDRAHRLPDIGVARIEIDEALAEPAGAEAAASADAAPPAARTLAPLIAVAIVLSALGYWVGTRMAAADPGGGLASGPRTLTDLRVRPDARLGGGTDIGYDPPAITLSPDGTHVVFAAVMGGQTQLFSQLLAGGQAEPIPNTEGATSPFFSPEGAWIGFLTNDEVKKVRLDGSGGRTLCAALTPIVGTWARDGFIYFTEDETYTLSRVHAETQVVDRQIGPLAVGRRYGAVLPDGRTALVGHRPANISFDFAEVQLLSLESGATTPLITNGYGARYAEPGYILFGRSGDLHVLPFDLDTLTVTGDEMLLEPDVRMDSFFGHVQSATSDNGLLVFAPGGDMAVGKLAWVDRQGNTEWLSIQEELYGSLDLSTDNRKVAVHVAGPKDIILIYHFERDLPERFTRSESIGWPVWSADGSELSYMQQDPDGGRRVLAGDPAAPDAFRVLAEGDASTIYVTWNPSDDMVALSENDKGRGIGYLPSGGGSLGWDGLFPGVMPDFSPDGQSIAYSTGDTSGRSQLYVRSYPDGVRQRQVSHEFGIEPRWCSSCGQLFFRYGDRFLGVDVPADPGQEFERPEVLFTVDGFIDTVGPSFDVSADGRRILVVKRTRSFPAGTLKVVTQWPAGPSAGGG